MSAPTAATTESPVTTATTDVVVVGAGLSGLVTARALRAAGVRVLVVEARDRVGGRTLSATVGGANVDLGGTYIGPGQDRVIALARELGCVTTPTYTTGRNIIFWRGRLRTYAGTIPRVSPVTLLDVERVRLSLERLGRRVPLGSPWLAARATELDSQTLASWLASVHATAGTRDLIACVTRTAWGCEPHEVSLLHVVHYLHACGGLNPMLDTEGGAQQDHFPTGSQQLSTRIADELGADVLLSRPVTAIEHHTGAGAVVHAGDHTIGCRAVVVAVPPALRNRIEFTPRLPTRPEVLPQRWPQGVLTKVYAAYRTPFWRTKGLSGQAVSDSAPVFITFDASPGAAGPGMLLGFIGGAYARDFSLLPAAERRSRALSALATLFGPEALDPVDYIEQQWGADAYSDGGPTAAVPPGAWTSYGPALAEPVGVIHWAGSETAPRWPGYLDGAVSAGERAAAEVLASMGSNAVSKTVAAMVAA